jgi:hypothetical protein
MCLIPGCRSWFDRGKVQEEVPGNGITVKMNPSSDAVALLFSSKQVGIQVILIL